MASNDLAARKTSGQFLQKNPIIRGLGGEIGLTAVSYDETRIGHFHFGYFFGYFIGYFKGRNGHLYSSSFAQNTKTYTNPITLAVVNIEDSISDYDDLSPEGMELETGVLFHAFNKESIFQVLRSAFWTRCFDREVAHERL